MSLEITQVVYGPTPLDPSRGEPAMFSFVVVCTPGMYKKVTGTVEIYEQSTSQFTRRLSQLLSPDASGNYPCHLAWDGTDEHGARAPEADYRPVFRARGEKEREGDGEEVSAVICSGLTVSSGTSRTRLPEHDEDCLAFTCSPVQACRWNPAGCADGTCGEDDDPGTPTAGWSGGDSLLLLPALGSESFAAPPVIMPALGPLSSSVPPVILSHTVQLTPPPIPLPGAISPIYFQPTTLPFYNQL